MQDNDDLRSIAASATARAALIEKETGTLRRCNQRLQQVETAMLMESVVWLLVKYAKTASLSLCVFSEIFYVGGSVYTTT